MSFVLLLGQDVAEDVEAPLSPLGVVFIFLAAPWEGRGREGNEEEKGEEKRGEGRKERGNFRG